MAWYDSAIFYHIYPLGMVGAEKRNDSGAIRRRFSELTACIPYLKVLGCNAVYIGPIFESSSHGYDSRDYKRIDRRLGSNEDFCGFVEMAHKCGIRVVVDTVFNHTGREFFAFQDLLSKGEESPYRDWYKGVNFGQRSPLGDPFSYSAWHGVSELPELNFNCEELRKYLVEIVRFWVKEFDIDGLRLDCADVLDLHFQKSLRYFTNEMKPEFWLMGEVIHGEYQRWVNPETLHSVTNYELHKSLYSGFNTRNFFEPAHNLNRNIQIAGELYTFLENHDVDRIASKLERREDLYPCYAALFTLPGKPSIYYGGEFALEGRKGKDGDDAPLRPRITEEMKPNEFTSYLAKLSEIHGRNSELQSGAYREILLQNRHWTYARIEGNGAVLIALSCDDSPAELSLKLPLKAELAIDLLLEEELPLSGDRLQLLLPAHGERIIKLKGANG